MNRFDPPPRDDDARDELVEPVPDRIDVVVPIQRGRDLQQENQFAPMEIVRNDVADFIQAYLDENRHGRGPFQLRDGQQNQMLPGLTVPPWLAMIVNQLSSDRRLAYNNDRPSLLRDMLVLAAAGFYNHLSADAPNDPSLRDAIHIIRHEETLRRELYVEQLLVQYTEDLTFVADLLTMKMAAGSREAVYHDLKRLFDHAASIGDHEFWRPTILRAMRRIPEITAALAWLREQPWYRFDDECMNWVDLLSDHEED